MNSTEQTCDNCHLRTVFSIWNGKYLCYECIKPEIASVTNDNAEWLLVSFVVHQWRPLWGSLFKNTLLPHSIIFTSKRCILFDLVVPHNQQQVASIVKPDVEFLLLHKKAKLAAYIESLPYGALGGFLHAKIRDDANAREYLSLAYLKALGGGRKLTDDEVTVFQSLRGLVVKRTESDNLFFYRMFFQRALRAKAWTMRDTQGRRFIVHPILKDFATFFFS